MKLILNTYEHAANGFKMKVTTCNKRIVTTENLNNGDIVKFNRGKLEWMINKGVFKQIETN